MISRCAVRAGGAATLSPDARRELHTDALTGFATQHPENQSWLIEDMAGFGGASISWQRPATGESGDFFDSLIDNLFVTQNVDFDFLIDEAGTIAQPSSGEVYVPMVHTTEVSGGQLQRATICRALTAEPSVVFADEPTGALISSMSASVMDALTDVHTSGATIVMVTHDPSCAARGDRVIYLNDGVVVASRTRGLWSARQTSLREDELLDWLRQLGF